MKNNDDLIDKYLFIKNVPGFILIKDIHSKYLSISNDFAKVLGWKNTESAINKSDYEIPSKAAESADYFIYADKKVISTAKELLVLNVANYTDNISSLLAQKKPIVSNNQIIGTAIHCIDVTNITMQNLNYLNCTIGNNINSKKPKQYILSPEASPFALTEKQQTCLALLIRGKSMKEMAYILNISITGVQSRLDAIKNKLRCNNKSQLIEKAIDQGFLMHLPKSLVGL